MRWVPVLGLLAALALVPGALAHHCGPPEESDRFSVQSTTTSLSPAAIGGVLLVPLVVIGGALAAFRAAPKPRAVAGRWVCTQTEWIWVPDQK